MTAFSLVENGRLTIPLFHGTSSVFYDSILRFGLGGRNIVEEMGIRRAARKLLTLSSALHEEENWLDAVGGCRRVACDPVDDSLLENSGFSFRYGGTYLSPSRGTAAQYSLLYPRGGEALTYVAKLYQLIKEVQPEQVESEGFSSWLGLVEKPGQPMVIEANGVELTSLRTEQGGRIDRLLVLIEEALREPEIFDDLLSQDNFELISPVPVDRLRFHEVAEELEFDEIGASRKVLRFSDFQA